MSRLRGAVQSLYYRAFAGVVKAAGGVEALPRLDRLAAGLGGVRCRLGYIGSRKEEYLREMEACFPHMNRQDRLNLLRRFWIEHQRRFLDLFLLPTLTAESITKLVVIENREELDRVFGLGRGVIIPAPHFGSVRLQHVALALYGYPISVVTGDWRMEPEFVRRSKLEAESRIHQVGFLSQGTGWMVEALKSGRILQIASTAQASSQGVWANLLGRRLLLPSGWVRLSRLTGAPVSPLINYRLPDGRHKIRVLPELPMIWSGNLRDDLTVNAQRLMDVFNPHLIARPEMVDWMYWLVRIKESQEAD